MDYCVYCGEQVFESDESVATCFGVAHFECSEQEDPDGVNLNDGQ